MRAYEAAYRFIYPRTRDIVDHKAERRANELFMQMDSIVGEAYEQGLKLKYPLMHDFETWDSPHLRDDQKLAENPGKWRLPSQNPNAFI